MYVLNCEWAHMHIMRRGIYGCILDSMGAWVYPTAGDNVLDRDVVKLLLCVLVCLSQSVYPTLPHLYIRFPFMVNCQHFLRILSIGLS